MMKRECPNKGSTCYCTGACMGESQSSSGWVISIEDARKKKLDELKRRRFEIAKKNLLAAAKKLDW